MTPAEWLNTRWQRYVKDAEEAAAELALAEFFQVAPRTMLPREGPLGPAERDFEASLPIWALAIWPGLAASVLRSQLLEHQELARELVISEARRGIQRMPWPAWHQSAIARRKWSDWGPSPRTPIGGTP